VPAGMPATMAVATVPGGRRPISRPLVEVIRSDNRIGHISDTSPVDADRILEEGIPMGELPFIGWE
jgi:hypothetical protein